MDDEDGAEASDDEVSKAGEGDGDGDSMPGSVSHPPLHTAMVCNTLLRSDDEEEDDTDSGGGGGKSGLCAIANVLSTSGPLSTLL